MVIYRICENKLNIWTMHESTLLSERKYKLLVNYSNQKENIIQKVFLFLIKKFKIWNIYNLLYYLVLYLNHFIKMY